MIKGKAVTRRKEQRGKHANREAGPVLVTVAASHGVFQACFLSSSSISLDHPQIAQFEKLCILGLAPD